MSGQDVFCLIMIASFLLWAGALNIIRRGWILKFIRSRIKAASENKREYTLTKYKIYGLITTDQYYSLQKEFGLEKTDLVTGPESSVSVPSFTLSKEQTEKSEGLAVLTAAGNYRKRVLKLAKLYAVLFTLLNEVNFYRTEHGKEKLEVEL
jgi:hypothetical protein